VLVVESAASTLDDEFERLNDDARLVEMAALVMSSALSTLEEDRDT